LSVAQIDLHCHELRRAGGEFLTGVIEWWSAGVMDGIPKRRTPVLQHSK
jgi:hypothetical protein